MTRPKEPAPSDPDIKPGGIRDRAMRTVWARRPTLIKETVLVEQRRTVITCKIDGVHALRPYLTQVLKHDGEALAIVCSACLVTLAAALQKHRMLERSIKDDRPGA